MTTQQSALFSESDIGQPLAARLRPNCIDDFVGQHHVLAAGKPLWRAIVEGRLHSFILWGPPGVGKTTLARMLASGVNAQFLQLSAVLAGVKEIRAAVAQAKDARTRDVRTVLFVDEVHRFNKSQQDAFLPHIEDGTIVFVGATTENPSFELNSALLSRARVYRLKPLQEADIEQLLERALQRCFSAIRCERSVLVKMAAGAAGDGRRALSQLELAVDLAETGSDGVTTITEATLFQVQQGSLAHFDKRGDQFYDLISALHKSVRGSDPDASLYWFARMLEGGCDAMYLARRIVRIASEDIGNADPRALDIALSAWHVQERLGSPEGELALAQAVTYLACAAKSNAVYVAYKAARRHAAETGHHEVPLKLRNAPTALMKSEAFGEGYRYAHDEREGYAAGECYWPADSAAQTFYRPVDRGLEIRIREKLAHLRELDEQAFSS